MTAEPNHSEGNISVGDVTLSGSAMAIGHHAAAHTAPTSNQLTQGRHALDLLKAQLVDLVAGDSRDSSLDMQALLKAIREADKLTEELSTDRPNESTVWERLNQISAVLANMTILGDSVRHVMHIFSMIGSGPL